MRHLHGNCSHNGKEFAAHQDIAHALKAKIFSATPYHATQRAAVRRLKPIGDFVHTITFDSLSLREEVAYETVGIFIQATLPASRQGHKQTVEVKHVHRHSGVR